MDIKTVAEKLEEGKPVRWFGKRWYVLSVNEMLKTVTLVDLPIGYRGTYVTRSDVPIEELGAYRHSKKEVSEDED